MDNQNAVPAPAAAAAVEAQAPAPTVNKPAIPEDIMDDMARAYVAEQMREFIAHTQPEEVALAITDFMEDVMEDIMRENNGNVWSAFNAERDNLGQYFDEGSIKVLGDKIDDFLSKARMRAVYDELIEVFATLRQDL